jgi:hypothetical protein
MPDWELPVYQEWDRELVQTSYHPDFYYRIFFGTVDWERNGDLRRAYTVFIQKGNSGDWDLAKREIIFRMPAHILNEDLDKVMVALDVLRRRTAGTT